MDKKRENEVLGFLKKSLASSLVIPILLILAIYNISDYTSVTTTKILNENIVFQIVKYSMIAIAVGVVVYGIVRIKKTNKAAEVYLFIFIFYLFHSISFLVLYLMMIFDRYKSLPVLWGAIPLILILIVTMGLRWILKKRSGAGGGKLEIFLGGVGIAYMIRVIVELRFNEFFTSEKELVLAISFLVLSTVFIIITEIFGVAMYRKRSNN